MSEPKIEVHSFDDNFKTNYETLKTSYLELVEGLKHINKCEFSMDGAIYCRQKSEALLNEHKELIRELEQSPKGDIS